MVNGPEHPKQEPPDTRLIECVVCIGEGTIDGSECPTCEGTGEVFEETIEEGDEDDE